MAYQFGTDARRGEKPASVLENDKHDQAKGNYGHLAIKEPNGRHGNNLVNNSQGSLFELSAESDWCRLS